MRSGSRAAGPGQRPGPGRPRNERLDDLILTAAIELIDAGEDLTVTRVVERSGVSRAALYRRWPSLAELTAAALDVGRTAHPEVYVGEGMRESLSRSLMPPINESDVYSRDFPTQRLTQRFKLMAENPELRRTYWESHVNRRRKPLEESLRVAVSQGQLRANLDVAACVDAYAGVVYYQFLVRGDDLRSPETQARVQAAFDVIWRGMLPER